MSPVALTAFMVAALPWLVVLYALVPPFVGTIIAGASVVSLVLLTRSFVFRTRLAVIGLSLLLLPVLVHTLFATRADQVAESAQYVTAMAMFAVVLSQRGGVVLDRMRKVVLRSGVAALGVHACIALLGLSSAAYYGQGEQIGFAQSPHQLAFLALILGAATVDTSGSSTWRLGGFVLAALSALATGVRAAFAASLTLVGAAFAARRKLQVGIAISAVVAIVLVLGIGDTAIERLSSPPSADAEEAGNPGPANLSELGSARTPIWRAAIAGWADGQPQSWLIGAGLRTVPEFTRDRLGTAFGSHSDPVSVLVELGTFGLAGWLLLWVALVKSGCRVLVVAPLLAFACLNGVTTYTLPLVVALVLAAPRSAPSRSADLADSGLSSSVRP